MEKWIYSLTKVCLFLAVGVQCMRHRLGERKDRKDSSFKELETNALQKEDQITRQGKEHQKGMFHHSNPAVTDLSVATWTTAHLETG